MDKWMSGINEEHAEQEAGYYGRKLDLMVITGNFKFDVLRK